MQRKALQTNQEKLLYAASLLGFDTALELVEDKIRNFCNTKDNSNAKDECKIIKLKNVD